MLILSGFLWVCGLSLFAMLGLAQDTLWEFSFWQSALLVVGAVCTCIEGWRAWGTYLDLK